MKKVEDPLPCLPMIVPYLNSPVSDRWMVWKTSCWLPLLFKTFPSTQFRLGQPGGPGPSFKSALMGLWECLRPVAWWHEPALHPGSWPVLQHKHTDGYPSSPSDVLDFPATRTLVLCGCLCQMHTTTWFHLSFHLLQQGSMFPMLFPTWIMDRMVWRRKVFLGSSPKDLTEDVQGVGWGITTIEKS